MEFFFLFPFLIILIIFAICFKSDLYVHEHDNDIYKQLKTFDCNFNDLEKLDENDNSYKINCNNHLYQ